jgi:hypothetical protein
VSSKTKNLGLLKKDPILDKNDTFNIQTMLNDNWDKLDGAVGGGFQQAKAYTDEQISLVTATGIPKLVSYPLQVTAAEDKQTTFEIPLDTFDSATDTLIVVINRAFLDASQYTVKGAVRDDAGALVKRAELVLAKGVTEGSELSLLVMKNVPIGEDGAINGAILAKESVPIDRVRGLQDKVNEAFQAGNERKSELVAALVAKGITATIEESWRDLLVKVDNILKATGDATANDILQDKIATTDLGKIIGTIPVCGDMFKSGIYFNDNRNSYVDSEAVIDSGYYPENTKVRIQINDPNLKAGNILKGVNLFGVTGTYEQGFTPLYENKSQVEIPVVVPANSSILQNLFMIPVEDRIAEYMSSHQHSAGLDCIITCDTDSDYWVNYYLTNSPSQGNHNYLLSASSNISYLRFNMISRTVAMSTRDYVIREFTLPQDYNNNLNGYITAVVGNRSPETRTIRLRYGFQKLKSV